LFLFDKSERSPFSSPSDGICANKRKLHAFWNNKGVFAVNKVLHPYLPLYSNYSIIARIRDLQAFSAIRINYHALPA
jgi:hypothetical protein